MGKSNPEEWNPLSHILFVRNLSDEKWNHIPSGEEMFASKCNSQYVTNYLFLNLSVALTGENICWVSYDFLH